LTLSHRIVASRVLMLPRPQPSIRHLDRKDTANRMSDLPRCLGSTGHPLLSGSLSQIAPGAVSGSGATEISRTSRQPCIYRDLDSPAAGDLSGRGRCRLRTTEPVSISRDRDGVGVDPARCRWVWHKRPHLSQAMRCDARTKSSAKARNQARGRLVKEFHTVRHHD
jgi:hypothetical protein